MNGLSDIDERDFLFFSFEGERDLLLLLYHTGLNQNLASLQGNMYGTVEKRTDESDELDGRV